MWSVILGVWLEIEVLGPGVQNWHSGAQGLVFRVSVIRFCESCLFVPPGSGGQGSGS